MKLASVKQIWQQGSHNAFTDLCEYQSRYFCCFREASKHISNEGIVRVLVSDNLNDWQLISTVRVYRADLRDPKLVVDNKGKLCLLFAQVAINAQGQRVKLSSHFCKSKNGITWSAIKQLGEDNFWLWRLSWFKNQAYGISYGAGKVKLNKGDPNSTFEVVNHDLFSHAKYGKAYPNESDIVFLPDNTAVCVLRRDADSCTAQLGRSKFPFTQWQWFDLKQYVGGPALILYQDKIILAGRSYSKEQGCRTSIWTVNLSTNAIEHQLTLPSSGDTSYPGLVIKDQQLIISYYSEHLQNKSSIYLAKVNL